MCGTGWYSYRAIKKKLAQLVCHRFLIFLKPFVKPLKSPKPRGKLKLRHCLSLESCLIYQSILYWTVTQRYSRGRAWALQWSLGLCGVSTIGGARYRTNHANEIPYSWHQGQLKELVGFLISRSLTLSSAPQWTGGVIRCFPFWTKTIIKNTYFFYLLPLPSSSIYSISFFYIQGVRDIVTYTYSRVSVSTWFETLSRCYFSSKKSRN